MTTKKPDFTNSRPVNVPARILSKFEFNIGAVKEVVNTYINHNVTIDRIFKMIEDEYALCHNLLNNFYWILTSREYQELQHYVDSEFKEVKSYTRLELQLIHVETEVNGK